MASSLNKVMLIGHLGKDPEIRALSDGKEVASFSIATTDSWKDKVSGEKKEKTEWHRIVVFGEGLIRIFKEYVRKGSKVYLEGQLQTRKWVDKEGKEHFTTEVVLQAFNSNLVLLDGKGAGTNLASSSGNTVNNSNSANFDPNNSNSHNFDNSDLDDEIPF